MATKSKMSKHERPLTLHGLLGALSYWGTGARLFLMAVVALTVYVLNLMFSQSTAFVSSETMMLLYTLGCIFVMDLCFVIIARSRPFRRRFDQLGLLLADIFLVALYIAPTLFLIPARFAILRYGALLFALLVIATRYLVGEMYDTGAKKKSR